MESADIVSIWVANHDPNVTFIDKQGKVRIYEYERFVNRKGAQFGHPPYHKPKERYEYIAFFLLIRRHQLKEPKIIHVLGNDRFNGELIREVWPGVEIKVSARHHLAHAACAYYQAPPEFNKCLVWAYDGAGFNKQGDQIQPHNAHLYLFNNKEYEFLKTPDLKEWGRPYGQFGNNLRRIKGDGEVDTIIKAKHAEAAAGKFMGYCGYGEWDQDGVDYIKEKVLNPDISYWGERRPLDKTFDGRDTAAQNLLPKKLKQFTYTLEPSKDRYWAACFQEAFTQKVLEFLLPEIEHHRLNIILVGGCALNVLVNQRVQEAIEPMGLKLFLCPNSNDSGLSLGEFYLNCPPEQGQEVTYNGLPMLDNIQDFVPHDFPITSTKELVPTLAEGYIIGCAAGNSEVGPRALGNRSILCLPTKGMKDKLNAKIKFREWFRPFAPVCRLEDKDKFFDKAYESPFMSFAPIVKEEYREALCDITHVDGTTRLQTVTQDQHAFLYELLSEMDKAGLIPVLLNTSFNIKGEPILTKYALAIRALEETDLDYIYLDKKYLLKSGDV
jgi:carbamoyltransferase